MKWEWILQAKELLTQERPLIKIHSGGRLSIALAYPNRYAVGMSNLGLHAVYRILNSECDVAVERVFYPEPKFLQFFKREKNIRTLESQKSVQEFDALAFSVSFEPDFPNIVEMLKMSGIPLLASDRENEPLVFAGGAVTMINCEPIAPFMDFIILGRAENILPQVINCLAERRARAETLELLSKEEGIYVPSIHSSSSEVTGRNGHSKYFSSAILTENTEFSSTLLTEIMYSCPYRCSFCSVGSLGKPKYRDYEELIEEFERIEPESVGLIGASINTHPDIDKILHYLNSKNIKIGFSSLRAEKADEELLKAILENGSKRITLAPEAGSEELRFRAGKRMTDTQFYAAIDRAADIGIKNIKLYFMIGLPEESYSDLDAIGCMLTKVISYKPDLRVTASISPFVPKPNTKLATVPQDPLKVLEQKIKYLHTKIPNEVKFSFDSPKDAVLQTVLARGGRELSPILTEMDGCSFKELKKAAKKYDIDLNRYLIGLDGGAR